MSPGVDAIDCIIVGGGPAGLTAATYLARFRRKVLMVDAGHSRAALIPVAHNIPGFNDGIPGRQLLQRLTFQVRRHAASLLFGEATAIAPIDGDAGGAGFAVTVGGRDLVAPTVIVATGTWNRRPDLPNDAHDRGVARGLLRYCPICDGYEVAGTDIAVIGDAEHGPAEALFLRGYTDRITLVRGNADVDFAGDDRAALAAAGIGVIEAPARIAELGGERLGFQFADGSARDFASAYVALGSDPRSRLAADAGCRLAADGSIVTDQHLATSVPGVWAIGDVVEGLDQVAVAFGHGAIAATAVHNHLRETAVVRSASRLAAVG